MIKQINLQDSFVTNSELKKVYHKRKPQYTFETVRKGSEGPLLSEGWSIIKENTALLC